ncbi:hypothetical protein BB560_006091 [Smittium megazygosporum]|uniref:Uncharacterized protein n=1 Tax=Smittium megazygosporum TaxID=133381 RepID=A0A2T9YHW5_9FUNG|nr:hypothetical protein BB560_006091 [Smittium megazygosporum]
MTQIQQLSVEGNLHSTLEECMNLSDSTDMATSQTTLMPLIPNKNHKESPSELSTLLTKAPEQKFNQRDQVEHKVPKEHEKNVEQANSNTLKIEEGMYSDQEDELSSNEMEDFHIESREINVKALTASVLALAEESLAKNFYSNSPGNKRNASSSRFTSANLGRFPTLRYSYLILNPNITKMGVFSTPISSKNKRHSIATLVSSIYVKEPYSKKRTLSLDSAVSGAFLPTKSTKTNFDLLKSTNKKIKNREKLYLLQKSNKNYAKHLGPNDAAHKNGMMYKSLGISTHARDRVEAIPIFSNAEEIKFSSNQSLEDSSKENLDLISSVITLNSNIDVAGNKEIETKKTTDLPTHSNDLNKEVSSPSEKYIDTIISTRPEYSTLDNETNLKTENEEETTNLHFESTKEEIVLVPAERLVSETKEHSVDVISKEIEKDTLLGNNNVSKVIGLENDLDKDSASPVSESEVITSSDTNHNTQIDDESDFSGELNNGDKIMIVTDAIQNGSIEVSTNQLVSEPINNVDDDIKNSVIDLEKNIDDTFSTPNRINDSTFEDNNQLEKKSEPVPETLQEKSISKEGSSKNQLDVSNTQNKELESMVKVLNTCSKEIEEEEKLIEKSKDVLEDSNLMKQEGIDSPPKKSDTSEHAQPKKASLEVLESEEGYSIIENRTPSMKQRHTTYESTEKYREEKPNESPSKNKILSYAKSKILSKRVGSLASLKQASQESNVSTLNNGNSISNLDALSSSKPSPSSKSKKLLFNLKKTFSVKFRKSKP